MSARDAKIVVGSAPSHRAGDDCGCCEGLSVETPTRVFNRPGLSAIAYRIGTHSRFKETMLAVLSAAGNPALADLRTRDDDDFSIGLLDAWAMVCDVLTFYQERIANESYLRSAGERLSVLELAKLLGYKPLPGVAASTYLAFALEEAPGAPDQALQQTNIPKGTRVNSVPGPGETQQTFETIEDIEARVEWNSLRPLLKAPRLPAEASTKTSFNQPGTSGRLEKGSRSAYLAGINTNLTKGDAILLVGDEKNDERDLRFIANVEVDNSAGHTRIDWISDDDDEELQSVGEDAKARDPKIYALRTRASLFGHNAIDPKLLHKDIWNQIPDEHFLHNDPQNKKTPGFDGVFATEDDDPQHEGTPGFDGELKPEGEDSPNEWKFEIEGERICLDGEYPGVLKGSWLVLSRPDGQSPPSHLRYLLRVESRSSESISKYGLSAKATCLNLTDPNNGLAVKLAKFDEAEYRKTSVFTASEELAFADTPLNEAVGVDSLSPIVLKRMVKGLEPQRLVFVRGKRARVHVTVEPETDTSRLDVIKGSEVAYSTKAAAASKYASGKEFFQKATSASQGSLVGEIFTVLGRPLKRAGEHGVVRTWRLRDANGEDREVEEGNDPFEFAPASEDDETIVEAARVQSVVPDGVHSLLTFDEPLEAVFDRGSIEILANVAAATHGETVSDVLGNGDASAAFQRFSLSHKPLTFVSAAVAGGAESTLEVRVGDVRWQEVPTLLGRGPQERVYTTHVDAEGAVSVEFGDGRTGGRLPTGQNNVYARYRKGVGLQGNLDAGQLSLLMDRPLGVQGASNPLATSGGDDPESAGDARQNAPLGVLTLERAVSLTDYEDFSRAFNGVAKALATWTWDGGKRRVFVTVAGPNGGAIPPKSKTHENLVGALRSSGDPFVQFTVASYRPAVFQLKLSATVSADYLLESVRQQIELALRAAFGFEARALGQPVHRSEVIEVVHSVAGVIAVDLLVFHREAAPRNKYVVHARLQAARPMLGSRGHVEAAELLLLDPAPLADRLEVHL